MTAAAFVRALRLASKHITGLEKSSPTATVPNPAALTDDALADAIAVVQDLKARLSVVEADLTRDLGQRVGKGFVGYLSDGRQYEVTRGGDRTAWDHDDWKRDVRRRIVEQFAGTSDPQPLVILDPSTGETYPLETTLQKALAEAQEVHGSTAPRSTSLKRLGLYAGDYSTTTPGPWRFSAVKPTTTTSSPEQNTEK